VITAIDTSILVDVFGDDPQFRPTSLRAIRAALSKGVLIARDAVWSEVLALFADTSAGESALARVPVVFAPVDQPAAVAASRAWRAYRSRGGPRTRIIADFLVGAHAARHADQLLTRDRGFYRSTFEGLTVVDPTEPD